MSTNRRRHANAIPIASFVTWAFVGLLVCLGGLGYVWCKNELYTTGTEIKTLEREIMELRNKNEVTLSKISQLSSTAKMQERLDAGFIPMVPIANEHIAVVTNGVPSPKKNELRAVSNQGARE